MKAKNAQFDAPELCEAASALERQRKTPRVFRDVKHVLANKLEAWLKPDANYAAFARQSGQSQTHQRLAAYCEFRRATPAQQQPS